MAGSVSVEVAAEAVTAARATEDITIDDFAKEYLHGQLRSARQALV